CRHEALTVRLHTYSVVCFSHQIRTTTLCPEGLLSHSNFDKAAIPPALNVALMDSAIGLNAVL
ncbi:MAG: hypothetical protein M3Z87_19170, partial [Lactobacillus sp.]|nr:hypothetical protein [Lactobacillus sp.]